jgi:Beta-1,3-glucanase
MKDFTRRDAIKLGAGALAAASLPSFGRAKPVYGTNNVGVPLIPFTITNETGEDVYMYSFGNLVAGLKTKTVYISNFNGDLKEFPANAGPGSYPKGGLKLPDKVTNANFPQFEGVRIYFSIGEPLPVSSTNSSGIPNALVGWINTAPEYPLVWDWVELNWLNYGSFSRLVGNITQVQMFGLAFELVLNGFNPADPTKPFTFTNGFASGGLRAKIIEEIKAAGAPWSNLILDSLTPKGVPLRVLEPGSAISPVGVGVPEFPKDYLHDYVHNVILPFYDESTTNRLIYSGLLPLEWKGYTSGGKFIFEPNNAKTTTQYTFDAPITLDIFNNTIPFTDGNSGAIAAALGASICRSTLGFKATPGFPATDRSFYYTNPPIFEYASIIHKNAIDNNAFCFGYDEVALGNGPTNQVQDPTSMAVTIRSLT